MAVSRKIPTCPFCGKDTAREVHKNYSDLPRFMRPIGDSFIRWEEIAHACKGLRKWQKEQRKIIGKFDLNKIIAEKQKLKK